ncbi:unnamed protein product [Calypogeia fissa]
MGEAMWLSQMPLSQDLSSRLGNCGDQLRGSGGGCALPLQRAHFRLQGFSSSSRVLVPASRCVGGSSIRSSRNLVTRVSRENPLKCNKTGLWV